MNLLNLLWYAAGCLVALIVVILLSIVFVSLIKSGVDTWKKR